MMMMMMMMMIIIINIIIIIIIIINERMTSVDVFCLENMKIYGDCMLGFDKKSKEMQQCFSKLRDCFGLSYSGC